MTRMFLTVTLAASLMACGDTDEVLPDANAPTADAAPRADAMNQVDAAPTSIAYAVGTDFSTAGVLSTVELPSLTLTANAIAAVASTDPAVRYYDGKLYIINRFGFDNVTIIDPSTGLLVDQISTGAGTNPQDVAVKGDKIYVCALNSGDIIILDAANPTATPATIDISSYDGVDGKPDCGSLYLVGDKLFATLALLDGTFTSQGGKVLVVDTTNDTVSSDFDLTYNNPFGALRGTPAGGALNGDLLITTTEDFGSGNGCVERITTGATPASGGCLVQNSALGGYASGISVVGDKVWLAVNTSFTESKFVSVSTAGTLDDTSITPGGQQPTDFAVCPTGEIVMNDSTAGGLRVYSSAGTELTTGALDIGQPPAFSGGIVCF